MGDRQTATGNGAVEHPTTFSALCWWRLSAQESFRTKII